MHYARAKCTVTEAFEPEHTYTFAGKCVVTGKPVSVTVKADELFAYNQGAMMQDAFKSLDADQREFLMSGMSAEAWDDAFGEGETDPPMGADEKEADGVMIVDVLPDVPVDETVLTVDPTPRLPGLSTPFGTIQPDGTIRRASSLYELSAQSGNIDHYTKGGRRVAFSQVETPSGPIDVSTVFLGIEHLNGMWFETMLFSGDKESEQEGHETVRTDTVVGAYAAHLISVMHLCKAAPFTQEQLNVLNVLTDWIPGGITTAEDMLKQVRKLLGIE